MWPDENWVTTEAHSAQLSWVETGALNAQTTPLNSTENVQKSGTNSPTSSERPTRLNSTSWVELSWALWKRLKMSCSQTLITHGCTKSHTDRHKPKNNNTKKHAHLTTRKNLKLQLSHGLVAYYDIQPGNTTHIYLLSYFARTHTGNLHGICMTEKVKN